MSRLFKTMMACGALMLAAALPAGAQTAAELLERGREAYLSYDFATAAKDYAAAAKKMKKADAESHAKYKDYRQQLTQAENFLERVEKIAVIDSITVSREKFFKHYRIPRSSGTLGDASALPMRRGEVDYVFTNEGEDYKIWAEPDTTGYYHLVESMRLTDDSWSEPAPVSDTLSEDADAIYPFMMADGVTLYYADNGPNSIGGYDIMVATRDAADGTFLQPSNLGFPYNSPYDDYLLAIDELNNVGWWATDRNQLDDELTIYVFIPNDLRRNYSEDDEGDITDYARISSIAATQDPDADYSALIAAINEIDPTARKKKPDFILPMGDGVTYTVYDDFRSQTARSEMKKYVAASKALGQSEEKLAELRRKYSKTHSDGLKRQIIQAEAAIEKQRDSLRRQRSDIYRAEKSALR